MQIQAALNRLLLGRERRGEPEMPGWLVADIPMWKPAAACPRNQNRAVNVWPDVTQSPPQ